MAFVLNDRVKETTTSTGTGTINLAGAETGFETFVAGVGNSNTCYYCIAHQSADEFEVGIGTVTDASPDTLSRTTIISSSNSDSAVDFSAGTKDVFCTLPASKAVFFDESSGSSDVAIGSRGTNPMGLSMTGTVLALTEQTNVASFQMDGAQASRIDMGSGPGTRQFIIYTDTSNYSELKRTDAKPILFGTDNTERLRITATGDVGIGETSPDLKLHVKSSGQIAKLETTASTGDCILTFADASANKGFVGFGSSSSEIFQISNIENGDMKFDTNNTERMRITSSGKIGIGTSDPDTDGYSYAEDLVIKAGASASDGAGITINSVGRQYGVIAFGDSGATNSGEIFYDHTGNALYFKTSAVSRWSLDSSGNMIASGNITAYGSPSDIKLKENIEVIDNALDKVKQLKGITYNLKSDGNRLTGLIAQDLEKVLPEAVYTSKTIADEREGEVSEEHLAIRYGNTVGLLVEAIKEQQEQIETLTAKVKELEDK